MLSGAAAAVLLLLRAAAGAVLSPLRWVPGDASASPRLARRVIVLVPADLEGADVF